MPINVLTENDFTPRTADAAAARFGEKVTLSHEEFERLAVEQRRRAFRIATVHHVRLVQHARDLLERAIRDGKSYIDFHRELLALFDTEGVPRPALHRLRLAYHQNTMQAYSDARRETLDKPHIAQAFPCRRYMTVGNGVPGFRRVRPEHAALHGKVFAWNDPFWDRFTPPWDYGCRCTFIPLTSGQVTQRGITVWTYSGGAVRPARKTKQPTGRARGKRIPLKPKPGFGGGGDLEFDLSALDADLRELIEERLK